MKDKFAKWLNRLSGYAGKARQRVAGADLSRVKELRLQNPVKSVGMKLFLMFFTGIVLMVAIVGFASYQISKGIIKDRVAEASHQTITQAADKLDFFLENLENLTVQVMSDEAIADGLAKYKDKTISNFERLQTGQTISNRLKNYVLANNKIADLNIIPSAPDSDTYKSATTMKDPYKEAWFEEIKKGDGKAIWLPTRKEGYVNANNVFALGRTLRNIKSGAVEGILVLEVKVGALKEVIGDMSLGTGSEVAIVTGNNKIVYTSNNDMVETDFQVDLASHRKSSESESDNYETSVGGSDHLVAYDVMKQSNWYVVGTLPVGELVKAAGQISNMTYLMIFIAAIFAVGVSYAVIVMIARPLVAMRNLMMEGARGNLRVRTSIRSQDEIGQLGQSFNRMMEQITSLVQQTTVSAQEVLNTAAELSEASRQTAISAKEIAVATEEIASGASSLAVEAERGNDLTAGISNRVDQVVSANTQMEVSSAEVLKASEKGKVYMAELINKTNTTEEMTRSMVEKVEKLQESTRSIRKILDVLNNMTKQTNILSLNATIEAARAGAAGKGFMVVADEIRKLADQSRQSIDVVAQITDTIQQEIQETVAVLSEAYPIFQEQIVSVKDTDEIFKQVQNRMSSFVSQLQEVTGSVQQLKDSQIVLAEAMSNVSAVAEESSATSEEVASLSSEQLNISSGLVRLSGKLEELSNSLKESLSKFTV